MTFTRFKRTSLAVGFALLAPLAAWSQVSLSVSIAPPPLPLYAQPPIPGDGYLWTPGYWAWDAASGDYVWVPGTWALPPGQGLLWTPGYWAFFNGGYGWHRGYWGQHVGYYGGLNYGYGYNGKGYLGGRWNGDHFRYNMAVNNIPSGRVHDVYRTPVAQIAPHGESYNGGNSHYRTQPTASQRQFAGAPHGEPTQAQMDHEHGAFGMPEQRMGNNHGSPPTAATPRPGGFGDPQVEHVRAAPEAHGGGGHPMGGGHPGGGERPAGGGGGHPGERR
jgi:hypothetical protein